MNGKTKKHILNVTEPVEPDEVEPFVSRAKEVLVLMGASNPECEEILRTARRFLNAQLRRAPPAPNTSVRDAARAALERLRARPLK